MAFLELNNVCKSYGEGSKKTEVLQNINLHVEEGEFIAIVGFTGSGKTTLISLIAGLLLPDAGNILLNGVKITEPGPDRGLVFQNYSLFPWLSVYRNIEMAVDQVFPDMSKADKKIYIEQYISMVNLSHALNKKPEELSGGMRQRVSVARALAMNPKILLLDEPLSALDALTRGTLQIEIERIWQQDKKTVILITNDVDEAILLADRIIPLTMGPNATLGTEFKVPFDRPRDKTALNNDPHFKHLRNEVTNFLLDIGAKNKMQSSFEEIILPDLQPINL
jgi:nitrate/nitrite transport system ATP-binding protein